MKLGLSFLLALALAAIASPAAAAPEQAEPADPACRQSFSLLHPTPDACLEEIETDRPHKTDTPHTLAPGHAQIEAGLVEYALEHLRGPSNDEVVLLDDIYKLGLAEGVDVEALAPLGSYAARSRRMRFDSQLMLRAKWNLVAPREGRPMLTLVPAVVVPLGHRAPLDAGAYVFLGQDLPLGIEAELNVGGVTESEPGAARTFAPVVTSAFTRRVFGRVSAFVEWYNETSTRDLGRWTSTFDTGALVILGRDIQLDAGAYIGLWGSAPALTPFLGISMRH